MVDPWDAVLPFAGTTVLLEEYARALPQVDQLCGAFWVRLAVLADDACAADPPSESDAALAAGTLVCPALDAEVRPAGQPAHRAGWESLAHTDDRSRAGTSATGVAAAVDALTHGRLSVVPISGDWHPAGTGRLLDGLAHIPSTVIANVDTSALWGSHTRPDDLAAYLADGDDRRGAPPDWNVGHFVVVWGRVDGPGGTVVAVADTYPSLGRGGRHLQPLARFAAALARERSPRPGGLLVVVDRTRRAAVHAAAADAGFDVGFWDG